jgi:hypothetical protein
MLLLDGKLFLEVEAWLSGGEGSGPLGGEEGMG